MPDRAASSAQLRGTPQKICLRDWLWTDQRQSSFEVRFSVCHPQEDSVKMVVGENGEKRKGTLEALY